MKPTINIDEIVEDVTLRVFQTGTKKSNYKILMMLPTTIDNIMNELDLSKVPVYSRIRGLEKAGLVKLSKGNGNIQATELTHNFTGFIKIIESKVKDNVMASDECKQAIMKE